MKGTYTGTEEAQRAAVIAAAPAGTKAQLSSGQIVDLDTQLAQLDKAYNLAGSIEARQTIAEMRLAIVKVHLAKLTQAAETAKVTAQRSSEFLRKVVLPAVLAWFVFFMILVVYTVFR